MQQIFHIFGIALACGNHYTPRTSHPRFHGMALMRGANGKFG